MHYLFLVFYVWSILVFWGHYVAKVGPQLTILNLGVTGVHHHPQPFVLCNFPQDVSLLPSEPPLTFLHCGCGWKVLCVFKHLKMLLFWFFFFWTIFSLSVELCAGMFSFDPLKTSSRSLLSPSKVVNGPCQLYLGLPARHLSSFSGCVRGLLFLLGFLKSTILICILLILEMQV